MADSDLLRVYHDLPITSFSGWDKVWQIEGVLATHDRGYFRESGILCDTMMRDDRIAAVSDTRVSALIASPVECKAADPSAKASRVAKEIGGDGEYPGLWDSMFPTSVMGELSWWGNMLGFGIAQVLWDTSGTGNVPSTSWSSTKSAPWNVGAPGVRPDAVAPPGAYKFKPQKRWTPHLKVWHPQYIYWDWASSRYVALCLEGAVMLPNTDENIHSDGKWFIWAPRGYQYGWLRAQVRRLAHKYIMRGWDYRDWARYCERHGMPILGAVMPANANDEQKRKYKQAIAEMANEAVLPLPQGGATTDGKQNNYDLKLIEATARTWQSFQMFKKELDDDIAISLLGQNLTTDAQGGSYALGAIQNKVRIDKRIEDAKIAQAVRQQVLWWDAGYNYGAPDLAPIPQYQVEPPEEESQEAATMKALGEGLKALNEAAPYHIDTRAILDRFGLPMRDEDEVADMTARGAAAAAAAEGRQLAPVPGQEGEEGGGQQQLAPMPGGAGAEVNLTPSAQGAIIKVDEARASIGLPPLTKEDGSPDPDGQLSIAEFQSKHATMISDASKAEKGTDPNEPPPPMLAPGAGGFPPKAGAVPAGDAKAAAAKKKAQADRKETLSLCVQLTARALRSNLVRLRQKPEAAIARRYDYQGLKVAVENPAGTERHWTEHLPDGTERLGKTLMLHDYGFLEDHIGADDEEVDCYVGPDSTARFAYVVHQRRADNQTKYDEDKVMLGFASADAAKAAFLAHRSDGEQAFGEMSVIPMDVFKQRLRMRRGTGKIRASAAAKLQALVDQVSSTRRALKAGRSYAGGRRAERYADTLEEKAKRQAAEIVAGDLHGLLADISAATDYDDLRSKIVLRYSTKMKPDALAELVKRVRLMAHLAGRYTAHKQITGGR